MLLFGISFFIIRILIGFLIITNELLDYIFKHINIDYSCINNDNNWFLNLVCYVVIISNLLFDLLNIFWLFKIFKKAQRALKNNNLYQLGVLMFMNQFIILKKKQKHTNNNT